MNHAEKEKLFRSAHDQLKMAKHLADCMTHQSITLEAASTLQAQTTKAHAAVVAFKSAMAGNEPPKIGS